MPKFEFATIRLGKQEQSIEQIRALNLLKGIKEPPFSLSVTCRQVQESVKSGVFVFIWLGSDNNKGQPTEWKQGLRAFGKIINKSGGEQYNDDCTLNIEVKVIFPYSLSKVDFLKKTPNEYYWFSGMPVLGVDDYSNQTARLINSEEERQQPKAFLYALGVLIPGFKKAIEKTYPMLIEMFNFTPPKESEFPLPDIGIENNSQKIVGPVIIEDNGIEIDSEETPEELIVRPFDPSKINISFKPITLDLLIKRINEEEIKLNTEFQRHDGLWTEKQQSQLIESLMIRIPIPAFYFDGTDDNKWLIVDGLQRLSTLKKFIIDEELVLENMEYLIQYNNCRYSQLPRQMQRRIEETQLIAFIINPGTPSEVKYNIFKRINTGGLTLEPQEIRHALNQGIPTIFLQELAEISEFWEATCNVIRSDRMQDREFILRFIAFNIIHYNDYTPDLDSFLNNAMAKINRLSNSDRELLKNKFRNAMIYAKKIFGTDAFRKRYNLLDNRQPINKALFETWAVNLGNLTNTELENLVERKDKLINGFINLMNEKTFEK